MARITKLPDDYVAPAGSISQPSTTMKSPEQGPALPPQMAEEKQSVDDLVKDLKKSPFFMTSLEDAGDEENPELDAIRALIYEDSRAETASNFREQGNEEAKLRHWREAKDLYTKGLAALKAKRKDEDPTGKDEDEKEVAVKELLLINRALCHLEIQNYRSCTLDCMAALSINPRNVKAHYRMASAFFSLDKLAEAASTCNAGLLVDPTNSPLSALDQKIKSKQEIQDAKGRKKLEEADRTRKEVAMVNIALKARQIRTRNTGQPPEMKDAAVKLTPDPLSPTNFIKSFGEEEALQSHLEYLLPLPWDKLGEYTVKGVEAYLETVEGGLIKWGKKVELLEVLSGGKVEIVNGLIKVNVVPKTRASEWIETVKKKKNSK